MPRTLLPLLLLCAACATTRTPAAPTTATAPADATIIERSHAVLVAYDHGDVARLDTLLATTFVHIDGASATARADDLKRDPDATYPIMTSRTWTQEQVFASPDVRIFRGLADEEEAGNEVHGNYHHSGWYTLVWVRESADWRVGMMTWQRAGYEAENTWNSIYRNHAGFTVEPNKLLVTSVAGVTPGRALDVATGQGRNGLYLASLGWKVTGVDFSMEGLRQASEQAAAKQTAFEPVYANLASYDFGVDRWDLVAMIYTPDHPDWVEKAKTSVRPGGLFVLEFFARGPGAPNGTDLATLEKTFAGWTLLRHEVVEDVPDWAQNRARLVRFVAKRP
jgi:SAM-dependent methyltransferase